MTYLEPLQVILAVGSLAWGILGALRGYPEALQFAVLMDAGLGVIVAGHNFQTTGSIGAYLAAMICTIVGALQWKKLAPRPNRKERKAWRELMGFHNETVWEMLKHDPRLENWPRLRRLLNAA